MTGFIPQPPELKNKYSITFFFHDIKTHAISTKCYLPVKDRQKEVSGSRQLMLWLDRLLCLAWTHWFQNEASCTCLPGAAYRIGVRTELQLPGKPLPQPCLQFFLTTVMHVSCLAALMQPDLSKLCHTSARKEQCLSALSFSVLFLFLFIFIVIIIFLNDDCEKARVILADMAANSYLPSLRDMIWIWDIFLFIIHLLS